MPTSPRRPIRPGAPRVMSDMRRRPAPAPAVRISTQTAARAGAGATPSRPSGVRSTSRFALRPPVRTAPWWWRPRLIAVVVVITTAYFALTSHRTISSQADKTTPAFTKAQTICLDAGHGGVDPGALSAGFSERDINLTVALKVRTILQAQGYQVFMTRTTNAPNLANADRYNYCNAKHATILVSIHHNFFTDRTVDHDTALYFKPVDEALATSIVNATSTKLGLLNNGIAQFEDGVLSKSTMPAALSEGFFLTSSKETANLRAAGSTRLADEAAGIAAGIQDYFTAPADATPAASTVPQVINRDE